MFRKSVLALTLVVLALAASAQAHALDEVPPAPDAEEELRDAGVDAEDVRPSRTAPSGGGTVNNVQREAQAALDDAQQNSDPDTLYHTAMDALDPATSALGDAQRQVEDILDDGEEDPAAEPDMAPNMEANSAMAWPELSPPLLFLAGTAAGLGFLLWFLGQTATIGAGAAGTAAARDGRRFLPYASPLFTRFEKDTVLGHPKREAIYGHIISTPGITLQDLCSESGLSRTAVTHHLRLLEQQHLVVSKRVGRSRHFFENGGRYGRDQKDAYAVLHNDRSKDIHAYIRDHPGTIQKDLCQAFDIQASVAHWHVKRLLEANLVEAVRQGRTVSYFPSAPVAAGVATPGLQRRMGMPA